MSMKCDAEKAKEEARTRSQRDPRARSVTGDTLRSWQLSSCPNSRLSTGVPNIAGCQSLIEEFLLPAAAIWALMQGAEVPEHRQIVTARREDEKLPDELRHHLQAEPVRVGMTFGIGFPRQRNSYLSFQIVPLKVCCLC